MKQIIITMIALFFTMNANSQDLIIKKNGDEIKAKVLEVALTIIKYKKFENINGPTFEILKSEIFMIKYENGTKDVFNQITESTNTNLHNSGTIINNTNIKELKNVNDNKKLLFTEAHRSTTLSFGLSALAGLSASSVTDEDISATESSFAIPVFFRLNKALSKKFSLNYGLTTQYYSWSEKIRYGGSNYNNSASVILAGVSVGVDYHFLTTNKVDPYYGLKVGAGYYLGISGGSAYGSNVNISGSIPVIYGANFGINIMNKKNNAWNIELGFDYLSYLKVGYSFIKTK